MPAESSVRVDGDPVVSSRSLPSVSIILPVLNEEAHLDRCLRSVDDQSYPAIIEIVVADGESTDGTRSVAARFAKVRVVDNPRRIRPAGLNTAIAAALGDIIVRVDARTSLAPDYVERCVSALERSGAAIVGGQMRYEARGVRQTRHCGRDDIAPWRRARSLPARRWGTALRRHRLPGRFPCERDP